MDLNKLVNEPITVPFQEYLKGHAGKHKEITASDPNPFHVTNSYMRLFSKPSYVWAFLYILLLILTCPNDFFSKSFTWLIVGFTLNKYIERGFKFITDNISTSASFGRMHYIWMTDALHEIAPPDKRFSITGTHLFICCSLFSFILKDLSLQTMLFGALLKQTLGTFIHYNQHNQLIAIPFDVQSIGITRCIFKTTVSD